MTISINHSEQAALEAIRQAHASPKPLTAAEEEAFFAFRRNARVERLETICLTRRGQVVYRIRGQRGSDLPCPPFEWRNRQALLRFQRQLGRLTRRPPGVLAVQSRQNKAEIRADRVLAAFSLYQHRGRHAAALSAKRLNEREAYVRRVLRENVHDRK